ncbi:PepSY-associated TM helix domain-containing protein [Salinicola halophilus]|uniref:PepSY-associated TM helix domain-containing protein n=1 Tax=Salinicola halophilus TaxID=184065 RepID=UPI000DA2428D|nr:PepSY domain-containing protein [Salinicola halophilus]
MARSPSNAGDLYRAVWRWHFYAGLFVIPFLLSLAVTGGLYLFKDEINQWLYQDTVMVEAQSTPTVAPERQVDAALATYAGDAFRYVPPAADDRAAEVDITTADGKQAVYVDPYSGEITGSTPYRGSIMWTIRYIHSLNYFGETASLIIEIVGGWAILLVLTGIYLWWPRGRKGGVVTVRSRPSKRLFWRDLHAVTGIFVGGFILFLAVTGMPWSTLWGSQVNEWANGNNFGYPDGVRVNVPVSEERLVQHETTTTWSMEQAQMPTSEPSAAGPIGLDRAVETFDDLGLAPGYAISLPSSATGVYTGSIYPDDLSQQRVVHLDQYSGEALLDMSYADYGPMGKTLEWGINTHMGQQYGLANQLILALACAGIVLLCASGGVMWWKRRPSGRMGVPPAPSDPRRLRGVLALLAIGGVIFPLTGASMIVMALIDAVVRRRGERARQTATS